MYEIGLIYKAKFYLTYSLFLQIYYKAIRDIDAGEELLVYMKDGVFPEESMAPNLEGKINTYH